MLNNDFSLFFQMIIQTLKTPKTINKIRIFSKQAYHLIDNYQLIHC